MIFLKWPGIVLFFVIIPIEGQIEVSTCGRRIPQSNAYITHGDPATQHWPWHAAIYHTVNGTVPIYKCGGSVISSDVVLTSGHCVSKNNRLMETKQVRISLGRLNLGVDENISAQWFEVAEIILHPNFTTIDLNNDIAIVRLSTVATFNNYVEPICLGSSELPDIDGRSGTVVGWGKTETGETSDTLREAVLTVVDFHKCLDSNRIFFGRLLRTTNFCAGNRNGTSVCFGDSGGSMTFEENGIHYVRGIVTTGPVIFDPADPDQKVCDSSQYSLFTDVAKYIPWIRDVMIINPPSATQKTINWAGHTWIVRDQQHSGPGPNNWNPNNVWLDEQNHLHLKIAHSSSGWSCAELYTTATFGFGTYRWFVEGAIDKFDPNIVLGFFTYDGVDFINEIDINVARWGKPTLPNLSYTIYPRAQNSQSVSSVTQMTLTGTYTTHGFTWTKDYVSLRSQGGFQNSPDSNVFFSYRTPLSFTPNMPILSVPLHINLWNFNGNPPTDGKEVEIVLHGFQYTMQ